MRHYSIVPFAAIATICLLVCFLFSACTGAADNERDTLLMFKSATVVDANLLETDDGNLWECDCNASIGERVKVTFNNRGTNAVEDDEIVRVCRSTL